MSESDFYNSLGLEGTINDKRHSYYKGLADGSIGGGVRIDNTVGRRAFGIDPTNGNREQLLYGDTGWRQVVAVNDIVDMPNLIVYVRRVTNDVIVKILETLAGTAASGNKTIYTMPTGFKLEGSAGSDATMAAATVHDESISLITTSALALTSAGAGALLLKVTNAKRHYGQLTYRTAEAWPTALPGSAVGTIPFN